MSFLIMHQTQPTAVTCFSTCLAMIKALPAGLVVDQLHGQYFGGTMSTRQALNLQEIPFESFDTCDLPLFDLDGVYLVAVPSLNRPGGLHQILVECYNGLLVVLDPAAGRPDCKYYVAVLTEGFDNEVKLCGYFVDAFIPRAYLLSRYRPVNTSSAACLPLLYK